MQRRNRMGIGLPWLLGIFFCLFVQTAIASDQLRAIALGGVQTALRSRVTGVWDNPAALAGARGNVLGFQVGLADWQYENLGEQENTRFTNELRGEIQPGFYLARGFGNLGIGVGYQRSYENHARLSLFNTESTYFVNEQRFEAETRLGLDYDVLWKRSWFIAGGYYRPEVDLGLRLRHVVETAKQGQLVSGLFLFAQLEDVNPNKADEVIPAIVDNLEYDKDRLQHPIDEVLRDRRAGAWDMDIGLQTGWFADHWQIPGLRVGVLLQNLLQRRRVNRSPMHLAVGASWDATDWMTAVGEVGKRFGEAGPELRLGGEMRFDGTRHALGGFALRAGWFRRDAMGHLTFGLALRLGTAEWEYALISPAGGKQSTRTEHWFGSTVRF